MAAARSRGRFAWGFRSELSPRRAIEILRETASDIENVRQTPAPTAYSVPLRRFLDRVRALYWIEDFADYRRMDSLVRERLWYRLDREGIELPLPAAVRYERTRAWSDRPPVEAPAELFARTDLFAVLSPEDRERLRGSAVRLMFHPGETIVRQAEAGSDLYVVERGVLSVYLLGPQAVEEEVGRLSAGHAFGEFSLLTGEPRTATVRALTEAVLWRIDKSALEPLLATNPGLPAALSNAIARTPRRNRGGLPPPVLDGRRPGSARINSVAHSTIFRSRGSRIVRPTIHVGIDVTDVDRIARALLRWDGKFLAKILAPGERLSARKMPHAVAEHVAGRFAAKEAAMKALGTGMRGAAFTEIAIVPLPSGKPSLRLYGRAGVRASELGVEQTEVSITHTASIAVAVVVLLCAPGPGADS